MADRIINSGNLQLRTEAFGDPAAKPLLLIMGASAPGIYWPQTFIDKLVNGGCHVIRYDNRDTGKSTCVDFARQPYTLDDMAADAVAVMDAYGLQTCHAAGASMGGMILQTLMLQHRPRLRSATIIMSSPLAGGAAEQGMASADLPGPDPAWMEEMMAMAMTPAGSPQQAIDKKVEQFRILNGTIEPFDAAAQRAIATIEVEQAVNLDAAMNHAAAINASSPDDRRPLLAQVDLPTLVVHGTEDPILPFQHGVSLAETIPAADLLTLERAGHNLPRVYEDTLVDRMLALQQAVDSG